MRTTAAWRIELIVPPRKPGPLDWRSLEVPEPLKAAARSVEFTCCALVSKAARIPSFNVFTTAIVRARAAADGWRNRTTAGLVALDDDLSLGIKEGEVAASAGVAALAFDDDLVLPGRDAPGSFRAPGEWTVPRFWGRGDTARPRWLPVLHEAVWTVERFAPTWPQPVLDRDLSERARARLAARLRDLLGVSIPAEHWGAVVLVVPDARVWTVAAGAPQGPRLGVEILARSPAAPKEFIVTARTRRSGVIESSRTCVVAQGRHALPFPDLYEEMEVEISDASSGLPVDRHAGTIMRQLGFSMDISVGAPARIVADFVVRPRTIELAFVERQQSTIGSHEAWEKRLTVEARRRAVAAMRDSGQVAFYAGSVGSTPKEDRERALADVRRIVRGAATKVWIWDKYFGARDVLDFLTAVADRKTDVRIMTSREIAGRKRPATCSGIVRGTLQKIIRRIRRTSEPEPAQITDLRRAVEWLRAPPGLPGGGLRHLEVRFGPKAPAHDRFLLTDDRCVLLGCSLNHIGSVCSTILDFPDREAVAAAFETAWDNAQAIGGHDAE